MRQAIGNAQAVPHLKDIQEATCKLCLTWWQKSGPSQESLVAQALPYVLVKALTSGYPPPSPQHNPLHFIGLRSKQNGLLLTVFLPAVWLYTGVQGANV